VRVATLKRRHSLSRIYASTIDGTARHVKNRSGRREDFKK
jgi:hypothetical protein